MYQLFAAIPILLLGVSTAVAKSPVEDCSTIRDDVTRLQCYDRGAAQVASSIPTPDATPAMSIWEQRIEQDANRETFTLTARKPNYFMYTYMSTPNQEPYDFIGAEDERVENAEIKFQLSFQTKMANDLFGKNGDFWFGYTQVSFWQLFNSDVSAPFRETNYEPELYLSFLTDYSFLGLRGRVINFGIVHQSNGRAEPLSRSWNRLFAELYFVRRDFTFTIKPWVRLSEDAADDDNPDIEDYLGHYELRAFYKWKGQILSAMLRNIHDSEHRYNSELQWSFPIIRRLRGLVQWYNGYGENLINHNYSNHRIGIGVLLTDWL